MGKYTDSKAWLAVLDLTQGGKPVVGAPQKGEIEIKMKPGMKLFGSRDEVAAKLAKEFKGCSFKWA